MPEERRPLRVLQLIGDTDAVPAQLVAVALHRQLAAHGMEVRTLALAPGRTGGLQEDVPSIAPGRRTFAARGQVVHESRWADVVVLHAPGALTPATLPSRRSGSPPTIVAVWHDAAGLPARRWSSATRIVGAAAAVIAPTEACAAELRDRFGRDDGVRVATADLADPERPAVDGDAWARIVEEVAR